MNKKLALTVAVGLAFGSFLLGFSKGNEDGSKAEAFVTDQKLVCNEQFDFLVETASALDKDVPVEFQLLSVNTNAENFLVFCASIAEDEEVAFAFQAWESTRVELNKLFPESEDFKEEE